ncbi:hypothetical protein GW17_00061395 [Ensete ventricosum]|nr:hypothetical protein GW17_00061395 [Ensete ventricosum]
MGTESTKPAAAHSRFSLSLPHLSHPFYLSSSTIVALYILQAISYPLLHQIERRELRATSSLHSLGWY